MTQPLPHEPVGHSWYGYRAVFSDRDIANRFQTEEDVASGLGGDTTLTVYLANSQKIIVRALSEERKAARSLQRRIDQRVSARTAK